MKEFLESLFGAYKGRYQNKFIGTFALFYLGLSWKNVIAIFFISEFSYEKFVELWSIGYSELLIRIVLSAGLTVGYLYFTPIVSFWVHKMQSEPKRKYKNISLEDEIYIINRRKELEEAKREVLTLEHENIVSKVENEKISNDAVVFRKLIGLFSEQRLRNVFYDMEKNFISNENFQDIKNFINEMSAAENAFLDDMLMLRSEDLLANISAVFKILRSDGKEEMYSRAYSSSSAYKILELQPETIASYREFFRAGKTLTAI